MNEPEARADFRRLVRPRHDAIPLFEAALCLARVEYPEVTPDSCETELSALAGRVRARLVLPDGREERRVAGAAAALRSVLHDEADFRGNAADYYDPDNSYLNRVLARRVGIPITLSILYLEVAQRAGIEASGVSFPGHFLIQLRRGNARAVLDPFHTGRTVSTTRMLALLKERFGPDARLLPEHLEPVAPRAILTRMLNNLKGIYARRQDQARTLRSIEMLLDLQPDHPAERRDRGLVLMQLDRDVEALRELEWYLALTPPPDDGESIQAAVEELRLRLARWN